jgi:hypothetical protein
MSSKFLKILENSVPFPNRKQRQTLTGHLTFSNECSIYVVASENFGRN